VWIAPGANGDLLTVSGGLPAWTAPSSLGGNFILNQNATDQTANFRISGTGRANTAFQAPVYTRADAGTVAIRPFNNSPSAIQLQNAGGTSILNVDATSNRVGINTTTPAYSLDVFGGNATYASVRANFPAGDGNQGLAGYIWMNAADGANYTAYIADPDGGFGVTPRSWELWEYPSNIGPGTCCRPRFRVISSHGLADPGEVVIDQAGRLGIGTTAPTERLHVAGNLRLDNAFMPGNNAGTAGSLLRSAGAGTAPVWIAPGANGSVLTMSGGLPAWSSPNGLFWQLTGNSGTNPATNFLGTTDNQPLVIRTNNTERMRVTAAGSVGIGTNAPLATTDIRGSLWVGTNRFGASPPAQLNFNSDGSGVEINFMPNVYNKWIDVDPTNFDITNIEVAGFTTVMRFAANNTATSGFLWRTYDGSTFTSRMWLQGSTGNLGIGTTAPTERLHVAGNLRLDNAFMPGNNAGTAGSLLRSAGAGTAPVWIAPGANGDLLTVSGGLPAWTAPSSLGGNFILNQNATDQAANFRISGTGRANTSFQAPVYTRADAGTVAIRPFSNSTTAIQLQNAGGTSILNVDATNNRVGIGTATPLLSLDVGGNTRTQSLLVVTGSNANEGGQITIGGPGDYTLTSENCTSWNMDIYDPPGVNPERFRIFRGSVGCPPLEAFNIVGSNGFLGLNRPLGITNPIHVGTDATNGNGAYLSAGGTWTDVSSRDKKERFTQLDPGDVLSRIAQLPVEGWFYKGTEEYHIGPYAEDFYASFGTGVREFIESDSLGRIVRRPNPEVSQALAARDVAGVALLGIKGLLEENKALKEELAQLKSELESFKRQMVQLQAAFSEVYK
jgi:hypothetical protein